MRFHGNFPLIANQYKKVLDDFQGFGAARFGQHRSLMLGKDAHIWQTFVVWILQYIKK